MSTETLDNLDQIRAEVSHESYKKRSFKREIDELLVNVTDSDLDAINDIRRMITSSTSQVEEVCAKIQMLSWNLINPTQEQLETLNEIIVLGKSVSDLCSGIINSLTPLWTKGVISSEIELLKEVICHWDEVIDDTEAAFFTLPANSDFMKSKSELESL